jgi:hypothetical protein
MRAADVCDMSWAAAVSRDRLVQVCILLFVATYAAAGAWKWQEARVSSPAVVAQPSPLVQPTAVVTPALSPAALIDARRQLDLARVQEVLEAYRARYGAYPSTDGYFTTMCASAFDPACKLLEVSRDWSPTDGYEPYWYRSDGVTYTLFSRAEDLPPSGNCASPTPPALAGGHVYCVSGGGGSQ